MALFKTIVAAWITALFVISCSGGMALANSAEELLLAEQRAIGRINLAARQRYLVQNITKSACFAMSRFSPTENAAQAWSSLDTFNANFAALIDGDPARDIAPEKDPAVQAALDGGAPAWKTFEAATRQVHQGLACGSRWANSKPE